MSIATSICLYRPLQLCNGALGLLWVFWDCACRVFVNFFGFVPVSISLPSFLVVPSYCFQYTWIVRCNKNDALGLPRMYWVAVFARWVFMNYFGFHLCIRRALHYLYFPSTASKIPLPPPACVVRVFGSCRECRGCRVFVKPFEFCLGIRWAFLHILVIAIHSLQYTCMSCSWLGVFDVMGLKR